ncbi:MAG TPA: hypothetical protein VF637_18190 [Sphingomicrobium sp.]
MFQQLTAVVGQAARFLDGNVQTISIGEHRYSPCAALLTIFGLKGLEFQVVHASSVQDGKRKPAGGGSLVIA